MTKGSTMIPTDTGLTSSKGMGFGMVAHHGEVPRGTKGRTGAVRTFIWLGSFGICAIPLAATRSTASINTHIVHFFIV